MFPIINRKPSIREEYIPIKIKHKLIIVILIIHHQCFPQKRDDPVGRSRGFIVDDWEYLHFRKLPCISTNKKWWLIDGYDGIVIDIHWWTIYGWLVGVMGVMIFLNFNGSPIETGGPHWLSRRGLFSAGCGWNRTWSSEREGGHLFRNLAQIQNKEGTRAEVGSSS